MWLPGPGGYHREDGTNGESAGGANNLIGEPDEIAGWGGVAIKDVRMKRVVSRRGHEEGSAGLQWVEK